MALLALSVSRSRMAAVTRDFAFMFAMRNLRRQLGLIAGLMAVFTGRTIFHMLLGRVSRTVTVQLRFFMAVHAQHTLLVMHIRCAAVFTGIFGIDTAAVTEGAGFPLVFFHKFMLRDESDADPAHGRGLDMAIAAGRVTAPAGLFKYFFIKGF